ncbi:MAG: hypothetical protein Kow0089_16690 [Desulfobulbaceae bacterium]
MLIRSAEAPGRTVARILCKTLRPFFMAITDSAHTGRLKNAILKGVYDENLRMASDLPVSRKKSIWTRKRRQGFSAAFVVVLAGLLALFFQQNGRDAQTAAPEPTRAVTNQPPVSHALPGVPYQPAINPFSSFASVSGTPSLVLRQPFTETVELNTDKLLDYSLILNNSEVRLSSVFGLDVQTIVIDPGHGGRDPGAIGAMGTKEKDIVLAIARRLRDRLSDNGYKVLLTREDDTGMSLAERVDFANSGKTDLFISLHVNALPQKRENLIETYYYGPPSDEETLRLAEQENRGSGILTRDFEDMIKKIGNTFKEQESATLAASIQHSLFTNVKKYDKDIANAGTKIAPFVVLLGVDAPSVLVEISCISKKQEELKLNMPAYRDEITSFLAEGIIRYLARRNLHVLKGEENGQEERTKSS